MSKLLIVEDDQLLVRLYTKKLTKAGFTVISALDGAVGLTKIRDEHPDLVLLDIMMPKSNGFDVLTAMQTDAQLKTIPVIVLTNVSSESDEQRARELGAVDYLVKANTPPDQVLERVKGLLT